MMQQDPETRFDPMSFVFPRIAKCTYKMFGASGTIETRDVMCLLATNIINEKVKGARDFLYRKNYVIVI